MDTISLCRLFDMRGYPGQPGIQALAHLTDTAIHGVSDGLPSPPDATDRTRSTSSFSSKVGSQFFISRNVIAAFAPTRLLPSMNAWFWQR
jgi:hypothetical protein